MNRHHFKVVVLGLTSMIGSDYAHAIGQVSLDTSSFFKSSADRTSVSSTLVANPVLKTEGKIAQAELDVQANVFLQSAANSITLESRQAYVSTSPSLLPGHQFSLGRKVYSWSKSDDFWKLGTWNPRFTWDPLDPKPVGLFGAFYEHKTSNFRLLAHASGIAVPERGAPMSTVNGELTSPSPFAFPLQDRLAFSPTVSVPIKYSIDMPGASQILFRPSATLQMRYGEGEGVWGSVAYGYMPVHQAELAVSTTLVPSIQLDTTIHPQFWNHHLLTGEIGYSKEDWGIWASVTREIPEPTPLSQGWYTNAVGPALIASWGGARTWAGGFGVQASMLAVFEEVIPRGATAPEGLSLPDRFDYRRALRVGAKWAPGSALTYEVNLTQDIINASTLLSFDISVRNFGFLKRNVGLLFNVGADLITTSTGSGMIGQYEGNDRLRVKVTYAF